MATSQKTQPKMAAKSAPSKTSSGSQKSWFMKLPVWKQATILLAGCAVTASVVICVIVGLTIMATNAPVKVSNEFLNDVQANNATAGYSLLAPAAQSVVTQAQFKSVTDRVGSILNTQEKTKSKEVNMKSGETSTAKVVYEIKGTDGVTYNITINLQKIDDKWKVLNFDSELAN